MIVFQNAKKFELNSLEEKKQTVSTLLIPEKIMPIFLSLVKKHGDGNHNLYLKNLLRKYRTLTHSGMIPDPISVKTEYQEEGQNLCRVGFRPENTDWLELGALALAFGKSRCWLFVYLMKLDMLGLWTILHKKGLDFAVPTTTRVELRSYWILERFSERFARSYHIKV